MNTAKTTKIFLVILGLAGLAFLIVVGLYFFNFGFSPSEDHGQWGQFGDYLGGTLNPIFGFLTLIAILMTLIAQVRQLEISSEELKLSRAELEASRQELKKSAEAQQETAESLKNQTRYTALSARIAAVSSAIEAIDQQLNRRNAIQASSAFAMAQMFSSGDLKERRDALESKLHALIVEAESA